MRDILDRYLNYNAHAGSYTWKVRNRIASRRGSASRRGTAALHRVAAPRQCASRHRGIASRRGIAALHRVAAPRQCASRHRGSARRGTAAVRASSVHARCCGASSCLRAAGTCVYFGPRVPPLYRLCTSFVPPLCRPCTSPVAVPPGRHVRAARHGPHADAEQRH